MRTALSGTSRKPPTYAARVRNAALPIAANENPRVHTSTPNHGGGRPHQFGYHGPAAELVRPFRPQAWPSNQLGIGPQAAQPGTVYRSPSAWTVVVGEPLTPSFNVGRPTEATRISRLPRMTPSAQRQHRGQVLGSCLAVQSSKDPYGRWAARRYPTRGSSSVNEPGQRLASHSFEPGVRRCLIHDQTLAVVRVRSRCISSEKLDKLPHYIYVSPTCSPLGACWVVVRVRRSADPFETGERLRRMVTIGSPDRPNPTWSGGRLHILDDAELRYRAPSSNCWDRWLDGRSA